MLVFASLGRAVKHVLFRVDERRPRPPQRRPTCSSTRTGGASAPSSARSSPGLVRRSIRGVKTAGGQRPRAARRVRPGHRRGLGELVEVGRAGSVTSWAWAPSPRAKQPLAHPFAWALVRLDGADTAILHAVDARIARAMRTGCASEYGGGSSAPARSRTSPASTRRRGRDERSDSPHQDAGAPRVHRHGGPHPLALPRRARRGAPPREAMPGLPQGLLSRRAARARRAAYRCATRSSCQTPGRSRRSASSTSRSRVRR